MVMKLSKMLIKPALQTYITKNIKPGAKRSTDLLQGSDSALCNLFLDEYCFNYK